MHPSHSSSNTAHHGKKLQTYGNVPTGDTVKEKLLVFAVSKIRCMVPKK
jgi:hypothetical protein